MYVLTNYEYEQFNKHVENCEQKGLHGTKEWFENNKKEAADWFWGIFAAEGISLYEAQNRYKCIAEEGIKF